jgi:hypothetical protein
MRAQTVSVCLGPGGGIGRRGGLKPPSPQGGTGSSPVPGTVRSRHRVGGGGIGEMLVWARPITVSVSAANWSSSRSVGSTRSDG